MDRYIIQHRIKNLSSKFATISRIITKFEITGLVIDQTMLTPHHNNRSNENIAAVHESVGIIRTSRCSQEFSLSSAPTWRTLRKDLDLRQHKIQLTQELKPNDIGL